MIWLFVHQNKTHHFGHDWSVGLGTKVAYLGADQDWPRLSTFSPLFVCTRLGNWSWDWAHIDPFADSNTLSIFGGIWWQSGGNEGSRIVREALVWIWAMCEYRQFPSTSWSTAVWEWNTHPTARRDAGFAVLAGDFVPCKGKWGKWFQQRSVTVKQNLSVLTVVYWYTFQSQDGHPHCLPGVHTLAGSADVTFSLMNFPISFLTSTRLPPKCLKKKGSLLSAFGRM